MKRKMIRVQVTGMSSLAVVVGPGMTRTIQQNASGMVPADDPNVMALLKAGRITELKAEGLNSSKAEEAKGGAETGGQSLGVAQGPAKGQSPVSGKAKKSHHKGGAK